MLKNGGARYVWLGAIAMVAGMAMGATREKDSAYLAEVRGELPNGGQHLLGDLLDVERLEFSFASSELGSATLVDVDDAGFSRAVRVEVRERTKNAWEVQVRSPRSKIAIAKGDMLFVAYNARCLVAHDESGEGMIHMHLQKAESPWMGLVGGQRRIGKTWRRFNSHAVASRDWQPGEVNLTLHVSPYVQTLEIGGVVVLNLGQDVDVSKMPVNRLDYAGREPDAPWRAAAAERIERHRKGDLVVEVRDADGNPVADRRVSARMTRHAYGFGSFFDHRILDDSGAVMDTEDARTYAKWFTKLFSKATTPVYWADWGWVKPRMREDYHRRAAWLREQGFPTRGHVLVWPAWRWLPRELRNLEGQPAELRRTVRDHVTEVVQAMKPYGLVEYDVMNEPRVNHDLMNILGDEVMLDWWRAAQEADGRAALYINEYSLLTSAGHTESQQDSYEKTIRYLLDNDAPLGGIGMQGHMGEGMTPPPRLLEIIDRFAKFGLPIQVTEFDIEIDDEQAQADYTRDFFTAVFSHPGTNGIVQWGFWEASHWKPRAAMFRKDWTMKPNGQAYIDLVLGQWWTDEKGVTDSEGRFAVRGFCGDYEVTVGENEVSRTCVLSAAGRTLQVTLP